MSCIQIAKLSVVRVRHRVAHFLAGHAACGAKRGNAWPLIGSGGGIDPGLGNRSFVLMCNLYGITRGQEAIRRLFRVTRDLAGNLPALPAVYSDTMAPVVRVARDGERELAMMRWVFPPLPNRCTVPVTNLRNVKSPYWRLWLKTEWRCLIPATSFCE
jgi:hypothetical protein